ncbi:MAG TPA: hypothetical protein VM943_10650 [Pyrinomonadaceae bacterium]|nr:hypothetical protein [Pyrinomonadaceae bacterium]
MIVSAVCAALCCACAASRAPEAGRPRANEPAYPILIAASDERREQALAVWATLTAEQGITNAPAPELQPVTTTLSALPPLSSPLQLPKIGDEAGRVDDPNTEEATRESLRRFIAGAAPLLGVAPRYVTLTEIVDEGSGTKTARYLHKPFLYPVRGGFGALEITFTADRRVTRISSTAVPDAERISRALTSGRQLLRPEDAVKALAGRTVAYTDTAGREQTYTSTGLAGEFTAREIIVYPVRRDGAPPSLAFHLAWEIAVAGGGEAALPLLIYADAVTGETLAAVAQSPPQSGAARGR